MISTAILCCAHEAGATAAGTVTASLDSPVWALGHQLRGPLIIAVLLAVVGLIAVLIFTRRGR